MTSQTKALQMFLPCQPSSTQYLLFQKQEGSTDCGLFAIAIATYLAVEQDPHTLPLHHFVQKNLQTYLIFRLEQEHLIEFPIIN